jgi:hypothetical protein
MDRAEMFGELHLEIERCWEGDDLVLVFLRVGGSGQASGAGFEIRIAHVWTLRDGLAVRGEGFGDRAEALKAAGIEEWARAFAAGKESSAWRLATAGERPARARSA